MLASPCGRRRLPLLVAALAMVLTISGCSSDSTNTHGTAGAPASSTGAETPSTTDLAYAKDPAAAIDEARAAAAEDKRPVLLDFGADWCPDCVVLDELYTRPTVAPVLAENFHVVKIDVGEFDKNLDVAEE